MVKDVVWYNSHPHLYAFMGFTTKKSFYWRYQPASTCVTLKIYVTIFSITIYHVHECLWENIIYFSLLLHSSTSPGVNRLNIILEKLSEILSEVFVSFRQFRCIKERNDYLLYHCFWEKFACLKLYFEITRQCIWVIFGLFDGLLFGKCTENSFSFINKFY